MSQKYPLNETLSPIHREGRNRINENWQRIMVYLDSIQQQINILVGSEEVDELLQRLNDAVDNANVAVEEAIDANNTATQEAIEANNTALQTGLDKVSQTLVNVNKAIADTNTATTEANVAKQGALDATAQAQTAINTMQSLINNMEHRGTWNDTTEYYKNNMAAFNGSTFIATQDNLGKTPPTLPTQTNAYWSLFAEKGATGATGPQGLPGKDGKDGKDGTGVNIIGELLSEGDLPVTGTPGDAYMIHGNLYVWQDNSGTWKNVGPIQGPEGKSAYDLAVANGFEGTMAEWIESLKGIQGPPGPEGPQGPPADLTQVNQKIDKKILEYGGLLTGVINFDTLTPNRFYQIGGITIKDSVGFPPTSIGVNQNGEYSTLEYFQFGTYHFQRLTQMLDPQVITYRVMETGKPWKQWRTLSTNNTKNANYIRNLNSGYVERTLPMVRWKNNGVKSEMLEMTIPADKAIDGIIELSISSTFANSDATGGAVARYSVTGHAGQIHNQIHEITNITEYFANQFYIDQMITENNMYRIRIFKRRSDNPIRVHIKYISWREDAFELLDSMKHDVWELSDFIDDNIYAKQSITHRNGMIIRREVPALALHTADSKKSVVMRYNANATVDYGWDFVKNNDICMQINGQKDVRFFGYDNGWFSIQDLKLSVSNGKANVAQAITDVGWGTSPTATFDEMASNIRRLGTVKEARGTAYATAGYIEVRGIGFKPKAILCKAEGVSDAKMGNAAWVGDEWINGWSDVSMYVSSWDRNSIQSDVVLYDDGFRMRVDDTNRNGSFGYYAVGRTF